MPPEFHPHEISGIAQWRDAGLPVLEITSPAASARVFAHGAQLTHWQPSGAEPVIFLSSESFFEEGKAIRGGVPVCFPWFGPRDGQPAHGFVRNRTWNPIEVRQLDGGAVLIVFETVSDDTTRARWPYDYVLRLRYKIGATLEMQLEVTNTSDAPFEFSSALHTYLAVGDARTAAVAGLEGAQYRDFPDRAKLVRQDGPIRFSEEVDRVFVNTAAACTLDDPVLSRRILVEKSGSNSTVVWNPWTAKAAALADFGDDEWQRMVCIETANAFENSVTLSPGETHAMTARISISP